MECRCCTRVIFLLMIRRTTRSTPGRNAFPTRRSSDLSMTSLLYVKIIIFAIYVLIKAKTKGLEHFFQELSNKFANNRFYLCSRDYKLFIDKKMEANKIKGEAKSLVLDNGIELTYCELGKENKEVIISGAFYFHTFLPVLEELAEKYHVYGIVMRMDGEITERTAEDGNNWPRQWGKDIWEFTQKMDIEKFHYVGKCHGTLPGWYITRNHPEALLSFGSFFLTPHVMEANGRYWMGLLESGKAKEAMMIAMRKPETGLKKKMEEVAALGDIASNPEAMLQAERAELIWDNVEEVKKTLLNMTIPVDYLFGTKDPLFDDWWDNNFWVMMNTKGARSVILEGERHLMELDCAERVAQEAMMFIDESKKHY